MVNSGKCPFNAGILKLALPLVVFNRSFCGLDSGLGLRYLGLEVVIVQLNQNVALSDCLIIVDSHLANEARNLRAERRKITANVRVVGDLLDPAAFPAIPITGHRHDYGYRQEKHDQKRSELLPNYLKA